MKKLFALCAAVMALTTASCGKSPAELCAASDTLDEVKSSILENAERYQEKQRVNLKSPRLKDALNIKLVRLTSYDETSKRVDCTAQLNLKIDTPLKGVLSEATTVDDSLSPETADLLRGNVVELHFSRQPSADGREHVTSATSSNIALAAYITARGFAAWDAGIAEAANKSSTDESTSPTPDELNAVATSEYDLVGVSPISECNSPQVQAEIEKDMRSATGQPPGVLPNAKWWTITGITTTGPSENGHQCHAFINMGSPDGSKLAAPLDYVTRYQDARLTVEKHAGEFR